MDRDASDRVLAMRIKKYDKYRKSFPYFKVQYYDRRSRVWREVQRKRFETEAQARKYATAVGDKTRVVEITREGRKIV